jgi:hypothetical protein
VVGGSGGRDEHGDRRVGGESGLPWHPVGGRAAGHQLVRGAEAQAGPGACRLWHRRRRRSALAWAAAGAAVLSRVIAALLGLSGIAPRPLVLHWLKCSSGRREAVLGGCRCADAGRGRQAARYARARAAAPAAVPGWRCDAAEWLRLLAGRPGWEPLFRGRLGICGDRRSGRGCDRNCLAAAAGPG